MTQTLRRIAASPLRAAARAAHLGLVVTVVALAACGSDERASAGDDGQNLTRGLLSAAGAGQGQESRRAGPLQQISLQELGFDRGTAGAPIRIMELSDYGCGYCRQFHMETFPSLEEEFIETGIVEWKFLPYVTGMFDNSRAALRGAECTLEQSADAFERLNDRLWEDQSEWKGSGEAAELVRSWALEAGADLSEYDACLDQGRRLDRIAGAGQVARELGVRGTPTFIVVGYGPLQGALPLDTFRQIILSIHADMQAREEDPGG